MLHIVVPERTYWDERCEEFITVKSQALDLEHSLASVARWEAVWKKPFLNQQKDMPYVQFCGYVKAMTLNEVEDPRIYFSLSSENINAIRNYIEDPMTATTFSDSKTNRRPNRQVITAEIIYSQMTMLNIPFECEHWHLNRLLTLIHVCAIAQNPEGNKMKKKDVLARQAQLNAMRKAKSGVKG